MSKKHNTADSFSELLPPMDLGDLMGLQPERASKPEEAGTPEFREVTAERVEEVIGDISGFVVRPLFGSESSAHTTVSSVELDFTLDAVSLELPDGNIMGDNSTIMKQQAQILSYFEQSTKYPELNLDFDESSSLASNLSTEDTTKNYSKISQGVPHKKSMLASEQKSDTLDTMTTDELISKLENHLPPEIWKIFKPIARKSIENNNIFFYFLISFFIDISSEKMEIIAQKSIVRYNKNNEIERIPRVDSKEKLQFVLQGDDIGKFPYLYNTAQGKLVRLGYVLKFLVYELPLAKTITILVEGQEKKMSLQEYIQLIDQEYIHLAVPGIDHSRFDYIASYSLRRNFEKTHFMSGDPEFMDITRKLMRHITKRVPYLCRDIWKTVEKHKQFEVEEALLENSEHEQQTNKGSTSSVQNLKNLHETKENVIGKEKDGHKKILEDFETDLQRRKYLHAKMEQLWIEVSKDWPLDISGFTEKERIMQADYDLRKSLEDKRKKRPML